MGRSVARCGSSNDTPALRSVVNYESRVQLPLPPTKPTARWELTCSERRAVVIAWFRSRNCNRENPPTKQEYEAGAQLVDVDVRTVRRYWQFRHRVCRDVGRPRRDVVRHTAGLQEMLDAIRSAQVFVYASFYIVTSEPVAIALRERALAGIQVLLYTDGRVAKIGGQSSQELLNYLRDADVGIRVRRSTNHEKFIVVDDRRLFLGSSNATPSGLGTAENQRPKNHEANVLLDMEKYPMMAPLIRAYKVKFADEYKRAIWLELVINQHRSGPYGST